MNFHLEKDFMFQSMTMIVILEKEFVYELSYFDLN